MINRAELERLAEVIFDEVRASFREQGARPGLSLDLPFTQQPAVIRQAYFRAAVAANTTIINAMAVRSIAATGTEEKGQNP